MDEIKYAYQCNDQGIYVGRVPRQSSPLEPGVWLVPGGAVLVEPPEIPEGKLARWNSEDEQWELIDAPVTGAPTEPTPA